MTPRDMHDEARGGSSLGAAGLVAIIGAVVVTLLAGVLVVALNLWPGFPDAGKAAPAVAQPLAPPVGDDPRAILATILDDWRLGRQDIDVPKHHPNIARVEDDAMAMQMALTRYDMGPVSPDGNSFKGAATLYFETHRGGILPWSQTFTLSKDAGRWTVVGIPYGSETFPISSVRIRTR